MDVYRYRSATDFAGGTFTNTAVDAVTNVDPLTQNVALSPYVAITGTTSIDGSTLSGGGYNKNGGNAWTTIGPWYVTAQANDYVEIIIPAGVVAIQITCSGVLTPHPRLYPGTTLYPSAITNGAIATILLNGTQVASLDCYNGTPSTPTLVVAAGQTIRIQHSGRHNSTYTPVGSTMVAVQLVVTSAGSGSSTGTYTSPVINSQALDTSWVVGDMEASSYAGASTGASFILGTGDTPVPDGTWAFTTLTPTDVLSTAGTREGKNVVPLLGAPQGQYAQWTLNFPVGLTAVPWIRNVAIYSWVPQRDPDILAHFVPVGFPWVPGPALHSVLGAFAAQTTKTREAARDQVASYSIGGSTGPYLMQQAADLGLAVYTGEPPASAQTRLQAALAGRAQSGSPAVLANQVGRLVSGQAVTLTSALSGGLQTVTASNAVLTTGSVVVAQTGHWAITITVPAPVGVAYPGLPGDSVAYAQTIITNLVQTLCPLGVSVGGAGNVTLTFQ